MTETFKLHVVEGTEYLWDTYDDAVEVTLVREGIDGLNDATWLGVAKFNVPVTFVDENEDEICTLATPLMGGSAGAGVVGIGMNGWEKIKGT